MKKIKKMAALFMAFVIGVLPLEVSAEVPESVDFSDKLTELKTLIDECEYLGIPTDYEKIAYNVIERFEGYINEDIQNIKPDAMIEFNISKIDEMYSEAKANLEAYLSGEKKSFSVTKPDMTNLENKGAVLYDGDTPVISVGYGAFDTAINDLPNYDGFGASNIQLEIGPTRVMKNMAWNFDVSGAPDASYEFVSDAAEGDYALKFIYNGAIEDHTFITAYQTVDVIPGKKYILTGKKKADSAMENTWISVSDFDNRSYTRSASDWTDFSIKRTIPEGVTSTTVRICVASDADGFYLDDLCFAEENSTENLLINPGFEDKDTPFYEFDENSESLIKLKDALQSAKENNVAASLLLSPHYFPDDLSQDIYFDSGAFFDFNICSNEAKTFIEDYLRGLMPTLAEYKDCIQNICISNEPGFPTYCFHDFFLPLFHEYLEEKHKTVEKMNTLYKTDYTSFSEVKMPNGISSDSESIWSKMQNRDEALYDWINFNDKVLTDWHTWMADIVREYMPGIPIHAKLLETFLVSSEESYRHGRIIQGADLEKFNTFSDYAGNDALTYADAIDSYYTTMLYYDYFRTAVNKPIYNSEDHVIRDKCAEYSDLYSAHVGNYLWMGAVHGRNMSTLWLWDRNSGKNPAFEGSILYRPDVVKKVGKTSLDLTRLSEEVTELSQDKPEVAIYYSKPSRFYDEEYSSNMLNAYKAMVQTGKGVGIVSDLSIDKLDDYKVLIIPGACYSEARTKTKIEEFIGKGGKVVYFGNVLSKDEYRMTANNSVILNNGYKYTSTDVNGIKAELMKYFYNFDMAKVEITDENTGIAPLNIDWKYKTGENGELLINITNLDYGTVKNISVYYNGNKLGYMTDLISGEVYEDTVSLQGYEPKLLKYTPIKIGIENLRHESGRIVWDLKDARVKNATIFKVTSDGTPVIAGKVNSNSFSYPENGCYVVKQDIDSGRGEMITVADDEPFEALISDISRSGKQISFTLNLKNVSQRFASGEFVIDTGSEQTVCKKSLKPGATAKISLCLTAGAESIKILNGARLLCEEAIKKKGL